MLQAAFATLRRSYHNRVFFERSAALESGLVHPTVGHGLKYKPVVYFLAQILFPLSLHTTLDESDMSRTSVLSFLVTLNCFLRKYFSQLAIASEYLTTI